MIAGAAKFLAAVIVEVFSGAGSERARRPVRELVAQGRRAAVVARVAGIAARRSTAARFGHRRGSGERLSRADEAILGVAARGCGLPQLPSGGSGSAPMPTPHGDRSVESHSELAWCPFVAAATDTGRAARSGDPLTQACDECWRRGKRL